MYVVEVWLLVEQREHVHVKAGDVLLPLIYRMASSSYTTII